MKSVLIVDDEMGSRESLKAIFSGSYQTFMADSALAAVGVLSDKKIDLVLLDVIMPEKDGLVFLKELREMYPDMPVIMVSASTNLRPVVEAMRDGAYDFVTKPFEIKELLRVADRALESAQLHRRVETLQEHVTGEFPVGKIIGNSPAFLKALNDARKAADTNSTVLICGESGTGKELVARMIHAMSGRVDEPFVPVHCAALSETLMESELFGHEKGAFTGAEKQKPGRFDLAGSGTIFFDEISEMSLATQVKLLRVLQEREFMRVGGTRVIRTSARVLAATGKDLLAQVKDGKFRDDLYYRIGVVPVRLPPLRERKDDIPVLAKYFLEFFRGRMDVTTEDFDEETRKLMSNYSWPGNVRELRNIVERMLVLYGRHKTIHPDFLPEEFHPVGIELGPSEQSGGMPYQQVVEDFERRLIGNALRECGGVQTKAARNLGTTRRILRYRMEKLNITAEE